MTVVLRCLFAGVASVNGKQARLQDIPGHHSFRHKLESSLKDAAGIVFVLDAVEITPHKVEAAEMLYELLTNAALAKQRTPLLLACNKADLEEEAHSTEFIRKTLERQLDAMRKTKTAGIGKEASGGVALGAADKPFSFQGLRSKVVIVECSAKMGQLDDVKAFIAGCL
jgi:signal recognition particle receptor subunit beta